MQRGEVYWADLSPTRGSEIRKRRPCVLVGATPINRARRTVLAVPLSSSGNPAPPLTVPVSCLGKNALAVCDQLRAVDKSRLSERADTLSDDDMKSIDAALKQVLCL